MNNSGWTQQFRGLARLSPQLRRKLESAARIRTIKPGERLFAPQQKPAGMLFLIEGTVRVSQRSDSGREIVLYRVTGGESCVMTTACLFTQQNYYAEGIAETAVRAAEVPQQTFNDLIANSPEFRDFVLAAYSHRIVDLFRVIDDVVFGRMDLRIAERLVKIADDDGVVQATHHDIATELGTAREVVSRQLHEFQKRGWLEQGRGRVRLLQPDALARFAASG